MSLFAKDKNGSSGPAFFWQAQLQKIEWYNTDKKKEFIMMIYSLTPSDVSFHTIWTSEVILANFLSEKSWSAEPFLY